MIGIIDYKAGNASSVLNALKKINADAKLISTPEQVEEASALILPGVGAAKATIDSLNEMNLTDILHKKVNQDRVPFLGICVGLQILFEHSEEDNTKCLGWLPGEVVKFSENVRIPQMGWNKVTFNSVTDKLHSSEYFYFVNSYFVKPKDNSIIWATTNYGGEFCSAIKFKNIVAVQFHVEKSGEAGLTFLKNFVSQNENGQDN